MKYDQVIPLGSYTFLSDLCGREAIKDDTMQAVIFLSDLCGREGTFKRWITFIHFLSDLCGREEGLLVRW